MKTHSFLTELETYDKRSLEEVIEKAKTLLEKNIDKLTVMRNSTEYKNIMDEFIKLRSLIKGFSAKVNIPIVFELNIIFDWEHIMYYNDYTYLVSPAFDQRFNKLLYYCQHGIFSSYECHKLINEFDADIANKYNDLIKRFVDLKDKFAELLAKYNVNTKLEVEIPFYEKGVKP